MRECLLSKMGPTAAKACPLVDSCSLMTSYSQLSMSKAIPSSLYDSTVRNAGSAPSSSPSASNSSTYLLSFKCGEPRLGHAHLDVDIIRLVIE